MGYGFAGTVPVPVWEEDSRIIRWFRCQWFRHLVEQNPCHGRAGVKIILQYLQLVGSCFCLMYILAIGLV